jgi:hypothetical protein
VKELSLHHEIHCSLERFWELFFDPGFTRELIVDGLGFASCDVEPVVDDGPWKKRTMRVVPKIDVPAAVAKLLGPKLGYTEHGKLDTRTREWSYEIVLSVLSDRIRMGGKVRVDAAGERRCMRHSDLWVDVRILGLGGLVERAAEKNMRDGWERSSVWMNRVLDARESGGAP